jgi:hypothetical protein
MKKRGKRLGRAIHTKSKKNKTNEDRTRFVRGLTAHPDPAKALIDHFRSREP